MSVFGDSDYLEQVTETLEELRVVCLGQDVPLVAVVPPHLLTQPNEILAAQIAEQLWFCLAGEELATGVKYAEMLRAREWLYQVTLFLLQECNREDQTFREMLKVVQLRAGIREYLFEKFLPDGGAAREDAQAPFLFLTLDSAILRLLNSRGLLRRAKATFQYVDAYQKQDGCAKKGRLQG